MCLSLCLSGQSAIKPILMECYSDSCLLEVSLISTPDLWMSNGVTIRFLVTSLTKLHLPHLLSLAAKSRKSPFFHWKIMEPALLLQTFNVANFLSSLFQNCSATQSCLWGLRAVSSTSWFGFWLWYAMSAVSPYKDRCEFLLCYYLLLRLNAKLI